jgi:hypothetical protein
MEFAIVFEHPLKDFAVMSDTCSMANGFPGSQLRFDFLEPG